MKLNKIGEFGLIEGFRKQIKLDNTVVKGSGDDCAVLKFDRKYYQLFTCDMIVEGVDFRRQDNPQLVGRKALAISISDIAACGGIPNYAVVALGIPRVMPAEYIKNVGQGLIDLAKEYKINIVGGDISRASKLTIDLSLIGKVEKKNLVLRSTAKKGDLIFVSGVLGGSIKGKHLRFNPRLKEARYLVNNLKVNSMIDISDGLAQDLNHILEASNLGAAIYEELIPISKDAKNLSDALFSGEDFELLFTLSRDQAKKFMQKNFFNFHLIGEIREKGFGLKIIDRSSKVKILKAQGYRHF